MGCTAVETVLPTVSHAADTLDSATLTLVGLIPSDTVTPPAARPTDTNKPSITNTRTASRTPRPTSTPTLTPTPIPTLSDTGPYLVYIVNLPSGQQGLTLLNSDGVGRKILPLPEGAYIRNVIDSVSPNGEWMAFHTGSVEQKPYDLTLNLMHLPDGEIFPVTQLLSDDYPNIFEDTAKFLLKTNPNWYSSYTLDDLSLGIRYLFQDGIYTLSWSPNSRYLAFAGQMNDSSSDIYRYDMQFETIIQLTDGPEQITGINWSPDGRWILHEASNDPGGEGWLPNLYAVQVDGDNVKKLYDRTAFWGWISPTTYAVYDSANGPGVHNLRFVDIETDQTGFRWQDTFSSFEIDARSNIIAIDGYPLINMDLKEGVYFISPGGNQKLIAGGSAWTGGITFWGGEIYRFVIGGYRIGTYGISTDGTLYKFTEKFGYMDISPNSQWLLLYQKYQPAGFRDDQPGIDLFSETDGFVRHITNTNPVRIIWRPDSNAIVYRFDTQLYYVAIPDGRPILVDQNIAAFGWENDHDYGFVWIK
jgi:WD40 repeat protein